ncbi:hypothetical protein KQI84_16955 [bacterium]|nr:hypothetical protein [bacterium]
MTSPVEMQFSAPLLMGEALPLPLLFGHFLPWYTLEPEDFDLADALDVPVPIMPPIGRLRHWQDARSGYRRTHLHQPMIGRYDSRSRDTIFWQIRMALEHGFTGFIINWYGQNSVENVLTLHFLAGVEEWNASHPDEPFLYFLCIDSQAQVATEDKTPVTLQEDMEYIRRFLIRSAYLHRNGRPIIAAFPYENNARHWVETAERVFGADGVDLIWMNQCTCSGESAVYPWIHPDRSAVSDSLYAWTDPDSAGIEFLHEMLHDANTAACEERGPEYVMGGIWPGFDDQLVRWAWDPRGDDAPVRPRVMCRETTEGNTLERTCEAMLQYLRAHLSGEPDAALPLPLIQAVTWNDYAEASTIEPTLDYGMQPLQTCADFIQKAREIVASSERQITRNLSGAGPT